MCTERLLNNQLHRSELSSGKEPSNAEHMESKRQSPGHLPLETIVEKPRESTTSIQIPYLRLSTGTLRASVHSVSSAHTYQPFVKTHHKDASVQDQKNQNHNTVKSSLAVTGRFEDLQTFATCTFAQSNVFPPPILTSKEDSSTDKLNQEQPQTHINMRSTEASNHVVASTIIRKKDMITNRSFNRPENIVREREKEDRSRDKSKDRSKDDFSRFEDHDFSIREGPDSKKLDSSFPGWQSKRDMLLKEFSKNVSGIGLNISLATRNANILAETRTHTLANQALHNTYNLPSSNSGSYRFVTGINSQLSRREYFTGYQAKSSNYLSQPSKNILHLNPGLPSSKLITHVQANKENISNPEIAKLRSNLPRDFVNFLETSTHNAADHYDSNPPMYTQAADQMGDTKGRYDSFNFSSLVNDIHLDLSLNRPYKK